MKENEKFKKGETKEMRKQNLSKESHTSHITPHTSSNGITLIALVITMVVHCDNSKKYSNNNGFLLSRI